MKEGREREMEEREKEIWRKRQIEEKSQKEEKCGKKYGRRKEGKIFKIKEILDEKASILSFSLIFFSIFSLSHYTTTTTATTKQR